jgi:DNA invertase Pin-like site-specific DNA recombinase
MSETRVALYARVSTTDKGQDPDMQLRELREYAARRGWLIVGEYVDEGQSGAKESRRALNRLMDDARRRKFDVVAVWKLDRGWGAGGGQRRGCPLAKKKRACDNAC